MTKIMFVQIIPIFLMFFKCHQMCSTHGSNVAQLFNDTDAEGLPSTFHDLVEGIKKALYQNGILDPEIAGVVKNQPCFENGIIDQKKFMDTTIMEKSMWAKKFYQCLSPINGKDETQTEEDRQVVRLLIAVYILDLVKFLENKTMSNIEENTKIIEPITNEAFHFVMRCFFNEKADPQISHENKIPFDNFSTSTYQVDGIIVTKQMIYELQFATNDPFVLFHIRKQYIKFQKKYKNKAC